MVTYTFKPNTREREENGCRFENYLVYARSSCQFVLHKEFMSVSPPSPHPHTKKKVGEGSEEEKKEKRKHKRKSCGLGFGRLFFLLLQRNY